jgi:hypothetical protein
MDSENPSIQDVQQLPGAISKGMKILLRVGFSSPTQFFAFFFILGAFVLFLMLICPLRPVSAIGNLITRLLGFRVWHFSFLVTIGLILLGMLGLQSIEYFFTFKQGAHCSSLDGLEKERCQGSKLRRERDLYMNLLGCVLYFSLHKIAPLLSSNKPKTD